MRRRRLQGRRWAWLAVALLLGTGWTAPQPEPAIEIDWRTLAKLNYRTGEMPEELRRLDGQIVRMPGFVVPLEDYVESASEFLLVPYYGACVHVPPPPPNQMVYVVMENRRKAEFGWWEPIWLDGAVAGYCTSGGYSHWTGQSVAIGFLPPARIEDGLAVEIEILGERRPARVVASPLWDDPRMRS